MNPTVSDMWADLKRALKREYGAAGAAEWLDFAARQMALEAKRTPIDAKALRTGEFRP